MTRRRLIHRFVLGTAATWCSGVWKSETVVAQETPPAQDEITLRLNPASFPVLNAAGGSVRLNVGLEQPVVISRGNDNRFYAVSSRCTHQGCIVNFYDPNSGLIRCSCHGSAFAIDGSLMNGPAPTGLDAYDCAFDGKLINVRIAGGSFAARDISIISVGGTGRRARLTFFPAAFSSYQVVWTDDLSENPVVVPFSLTSDGAAAQTTYLNTDFDPLDPTPRVALYVDISGPRGFFSITLVVTEYA